MDGSSTVKITLTATMDQFEEAAITAWIDAYTGFADEKPNHQAPIPKPLIELARLVASGVHRPIAKQHIYDETDSTVDWRGLGDPLRVWLEDNRVAAGRLPAKVLGMIQQVAQE